MASLAMHDASQGWNEASPSSGPDYNNWAYLSTPPQPASIAKPSPPSMPMIPQPLMDENLVSPMPSLNAIPDAGWASWGTDPSKIKKEEEQVRRAPPAISQNSLSMSVKGRSPSSFSRNGQVSHTNGFHHPSPPSISSPPSSARQPAQADGRNGSLPGRNGWQFNGHTSNFQVPARIPGQVPVCLPGQQHRQYPVTSSTHPTNSRETLPGHSSLSMRPPQVPVRYTTRPTFQYGKPAQPVKPIISEVISPANQALPLPPAPAEARGAIHEDTSPAPSQNSPQTQSQWKVLKPAGTIKIPSGADGDGHGASSMLMSPKSTLSNSKFGTSRNGSGSTAVAPTVLEHSTTSGNNHSVPANVIGWEDEPFTQSTSALTQSTSADSGHASVSSGPPSTFVPSSVPSTSPKVNLPSIQQAQATSLLTASDTVSRNEPASKKSRAFQLHIPTSVSLAKALRALDIENLEALAGNKVKIDLDYSHRLVKFEVGLGTSSTRRVCLTCIQVAVSALSEACAPETYEVKDEATKAFIAGGDEKATSITEPRNDLLEDHSTAAVELEYSVKDIDSSNCTKNADLPLQSTTPEHHDAVRTVTGSMTGLSYAELQPIVSEPQSDVTASHLLSLLKNYGSTVPVETALPAKFTGGNVESSMTSPPTFSSSDTKSISQVKASTALPLPSNDVDLSGQTQSPTEGDFSMLATPSSLSNTAEPDDPRGHPLIKRSIRYAHLLELPLRIPEQVYDQNIKLCRLQQHIPLEEVYYNRKNHLVFLRHQKIANLEFARIVLLIVLQLVDPNFPPDQATFQLDGGSPGQKLANELRGDKYHPMRKANMDELTAYITNRLRDIEAKSDQSGRNHSIDASAIAADSNTSLQASASVAGTTASQEAKSVTLIQNSELKRLASSQSAPDANHVPIEKPTHEPKVAEPEVPPISGHSSRQHTMQTSGKEGRLTFEELQDRLTPHNSICWFLPNSSWRNRFLGPTGCNLKSIRDTTGVANIFWRSDAGRAGDCFLIIVGGYSQTLTSAERYVLGHAFRLCKAWAIAANAEDMLPVTSDIPEVNRYDVNFRLNEYELKLAISNLYDLRRLCREAMFKQYPAALVRLAKLCDRHRQPSNTVLAAKTARPALVEELCTGQNSICWTARGRSAALQLSGYHGRHLHTLEDIFGMAAIKIDLNEHRYGKDGVRICILACNGPQASEAQKESLTRTFRSIVAIVRSLGHDTLLPTGTNLDTPSLGFPLLRFGPADARRISQALVELHDSNLSDGDIRMIVSILFPASLPNSPIKSSTGREHLVEQTEDSQALDGSPSAGQSQYAMTATSAGDQASISELAVNIPHIELPLEHNRHHTLSSQAEDASSDSVPGVFDPNLQGDTTFDALYVGYNSIRDIPGFATDLGAVDDGYIAIQDESSLYEDWSSRWSVLSHQKRMELIGSAHWATTSFRYMLLTRHEFESVGPSASQLGGFTEEDTTAEGSHRGSNNNINPSGWQFAHEQVEAEQTVLPRVQDWAERVARDADIGQSMTPVGRRATSPLFKSTQGSIGNHQVVCGANQRSSET